VTAGAIRPIIDPGWMVRYLRDMLCTTRLSRNAVFAATIPGTSSKLETKNGALQTVISFRTTLISEAMGGLYAKHLAHSHCRNALSGGFLLLWGYNEYWEPIERHSSRGDNFFEPDNFS